MTLQKARGGFRPFAVVLALAATTAFWLPTVAVRPAATAPAVVVVTSPGAFVPALM
ncbi:hypothetical protein [Novosphingobium beihaiensis]|uniref:Uncharacterized protein n=1 Tax=Novosphingobium beihaiensis TaxID=2930389 RepID=A0ABT0BV44_9SPHN|nr:hypothetical protein [Novosphingobium beihaiensis]MCJ2188748.1 hypothetical protein [Novosphingobium beihaiensis]